MSWNVAEHDVLDAEHFRLPGMLEILKAVQYARKSPKFIEPMLRGDLRLRSMAEARAPSTLVGERRRP